MATNLEAAQPAPIEEAHRLLDRDDGIFYAIADWDEHDVSVVDWQGQQIDIEYARSRDRYQPVRIAGLEE